MMTHIQNEPKEEELKQDYLNKAQEELSSNHPETIPSLLKSLISQDLIQIPVISDAGRVYDKGDIEQWLETHDCDELRQPLSIEMLHPFPELNTLIEQYKSTLLNYRAQRNRLLDLARNTLAYPTAEIADIFHCPISKEIIKNPVISNVGVIYDEATFQSQSDLNSKETVVPFPEFKQYLNFYQWKRKEKQTKPIQESVKLQENSVIPLTQVFSYVYSCAMSFFSSNECTTSELATTVESSMDLVS